MLKARGQRKNKLFVCFKLHGFHLHDRIYSLFFFCVMECLLLPWSRVLHTHVILILILSGYITKTLNTNFIFYLNEFY